MYGIQQIGRPRHPALVAEYHLMGEQPDFSLGQDLFDPGSGEYETDIGSWIPIGSNTVEVSTDIAYGGLQSVKITYVDSTSGARLFLSDGNDLITDLTVGKKYRIAGQVAVNAGSSVPLYLNDSAVNGTIDIVTSETMVPFSFDFIALHATSSFLWPNIGVGEIIYLDNLTIQEIEEGDLFDLTKGGFETDTGSWVALNANTIEVSTDKAHSGSKSLKVTFVDHAGGAYMFCSAAGDLITNLVVGKKYRVKGWLAVSSGASLRLEVWNNVGSSIGNSATVTSETMVPISVDFIAENTALDTIRLGNMGAGEIAYLDDITLQELYTPDMSGRANHGTVDGATATPWGYLFDGAENNILVPDNPSLEPPNITVLALVNSADLVGTSDRIVEKAGSNVGYTLYNNGGELIWVIGNTSGWSVITHDTDMVIDRDYWVAGTWDGVTQRIFLDLIEGNIATPSTPDLTGGGNLIIGNLAAGGQGWDGPIRKLYIYNQALTQREIWEEMRQGRPGLRIF